MSLSFIDQHQNTGVEGASKNSLKNALDYCHKSMVNKHSNQRQYFNIALIDHILQLQKQQIKAQLKIPAKVRIDTIDHKFNDCFQYIQKIYKDYDAFIEMIDICDYYKYYLQQPLIASSSLFKLLFCYSEKKKEIMYKKLKKQLNIKQQISITENQNTSIHEKSEIQQQNLSHFLTKNSISRDYDTKDQSECFYNLNEKLARKFGHSKQKSMLELDRQYDFQKKIMSYQISNFKNNQRKCKRLNIKKQFNKQLMLDSTKNTSTQIQSNLSLLKKMKSCQINQANILRKNTQFQKPKKLNVKNVIKRNTSIVSQRQKSQQIKHIYQNKIKIAIRLSNQANSQNAIFQDKKLQKNKSKKRLRKRSCQNIIMKKYNTVQNENLDFYNVSSIYTQNLPRENKVKDKRKFRHYRSQQISQNLDEAEPKQSQKIISRQLTNKLINNSIQYEIAKNGFKTTIQNFKNKIRDYKNEIFMIQRKNQKNTKASNRGSTINLHYNKFHRQKTQNIQNYKFIQKCKLKQCRR